MSGAFVVNGGKVVEWLKALGVDVPLSRRCVIDLEVGQPARIYVEGFANAKMFDVRFPYEPSEIEIVTNSLSEST